MSAATAKNSESKVSKGNTAEVEHPVSDKVRETLHRSVDAVADKAAETESGLRSTAEASTESLAKKRDELEAQWNGSSIKRYAVENPVATASLAFAAGALIASLLTKKRN